MNQKLQKITRDIERTKEKIEELRALLPELERQKTEMENAEIVKVFRTADVSPDDFAAFIAAYRTQATGGAPAGNTTAPQASGYTGTTSRLNDMEDSDDE